MAGQAGRTGFGDALRSLTLTTRGLLFLLAGAFAFLAARVFSVSSFNYVACLLIGLVVFAVAFVAIGQSQVHVVRAFTPFRISPGEKAVATVTFTNLSALPSLEATWQDKVPAGVSGAASGSLAALGGGHSAQARTRFTYVLQGQRRGSFAIGPLTVHVPDPFGLVFRTHTFGESRDLLVLPRQIDLPEISFGNANISGASRPASRNAGIGDDDVIARSYFPGDSLRRMHWKATAHHGALMVRQEEQHDKPEATVLLDLDAGRHDAIRDHHGAWSFSPAFEWSIVAAASVATHLCRRGYLVNVIAPGSAIRRSIADGLDSLEDVLTDLAVVDPQPVTAEDVARIGPSERPVVAVLGRVDEDTALAWSRLNTTTGLVLLAIGSSAGAIDLLNAAGWKSRTYHPREDLAELWLELDARDFHAAR